VFYFAAPGWNYESGPVNYQFFYEEGGVNFPLTAKLSSPYYESTLPPCTSVKMRVTDNYGAFTERTVGVAVTGSFNEEIDDIFSSKLNSLLARIGGSDPSILNEVAVLIGMLSIMD